MRRKQLIIFGNGQLAQIAQYYFHNDSPYEVAAFCVDRPFSNGTASFGGMPLIPSDELSNFTPDEYAFFVAIGYSALNNNRKKVYERLKDAGYELVSYISSKATVLNDGNIGDNCFILEDNTIQPFVEIHDNVYLWSGNHIGHNSVIMSHSFISSHVVISGGVEVGERCFIGVNSTIRNEVKIGARSIIGAGSLILKDVPEAGVCCPKGTDLQKISSDRFIKMGFVI